MLRRIAGVDLVTAAALSVGVVLGGRWWIASAVVWLLGFLWALTTLPSPPGLGARARSSAVLTVMTGLPLCAALGLLASRRGRPATTAGLLVAGAVAVGLVVVWAVLLVVRLAVRARTLPSTGPGRPALAVAGAAAALAVLPVAVPVGVDRLLEARVTDRVRRCPAMVRFAGGDATRGLRNELAAACDLLAGGHLRATRRSGDVELAVYGSDPHLHPEVVEVALSALDHHQALLGPPAGASISVLPVRLSGAVRGMAGPGYLLVHPAELVRPRECGPFRASAGVEGRCGAWVLAHELAHQWFSWTAYEQGTEAWPALIEGTADYLAFSWWRSAYGAADAERIAVDLFDGRLALARGFATAHPPARPPRNMSDAEGRAVIYGRPSAAWVAAERAAGPPATLLALRAVLEAGREADPSITEVLAAVAVAAPDVAPVLQRWWLDPGFEPRLPAAAPP